MYALYLEGSSNPVYEYKTWRGLQKRLAALAADTRLGSVQVNVGEEKIKVRLHRGSNGYGWDTAVGHGIPHDQGLRQSAFSRSW